MKKRTFALSLSAVIALSLVGCSSTPTETTAQQTEATTAGAASESTKATPPVRGPGTERHQAYHRLVGKSGEK